MLTAQSLPRNTPTDANTNDVTVAPCCTHFRRSGRTVAGDEQPGCCCRHRVPLFGPGNLAGVTLMSGRHLEVRAPTAPLFRWCRQTPGLLFLRLPERRRLCRHDNSVRTGQSVWQLVFIGQQDLALVKVGWWGGDGLFVRASVIARQPVRGATRTKRRASDGNGGT